MFCLALLLPLLSMSAQAAEPSVMVLSTTKDTATLLVKSGELTETVTLSAGQTATVANQSISVAFVGADKVVLAVNGAATTLSVGASAAVVGGLSVITPAIAGAAVVAGALAATSQNGSTTTHHATTHHP
jgi:hypothetical protein